jgi:tellurite resistance protein TerC
VHKFRYLKEGIAIILIFIGAKMLVDYFGFHLPVIASLIVIVVCFTGSILLSIYKNIQESKK